MIARSLVLSALVGLVGCQVVQPTPVPSAGPTSQASPSATVPGPTPTPADLGREWGLMPDRDALAGIGVLTGLAAGERGIVVTGAGGTTGAGGVAWSVDGRAWTVVDPGPAGLPVAATAGGFFALGDGVAWSSADGRSWTRTDTRFSGWAVADIAAGGPTLFAVGSYLTPDGSIGVGGAWRSTDGWTWQDLNGNFVALEHVAASGDLAVAFGRSSTGGSRAYVGGPDGEFTALEQPFSPDGEVTAVAARPGGGFVAVGQDLSDGRRYAAVWTSGDGLAWSETRATGVPIDVRPTAVAVAGGVIVMATDGVTRMWRSEDGRSWIPAADVPSLELGVPTRLATSPAGLIALGDPQATEGPLLEWTSPPVEPEPAAVGAWAEMERLPTASTGDRLVALSDGSLVLLGGATVADGWTTYATDTWRRDLAGRWTRRAAMPVGRVSPVAAVASDDRVWLVGGLLASDPGSPTRRVDVYDPGTDRWSAGPALPSGLEVADAVALADGSVVAVGRGDAGDVELWRLPAGATIWRSLARDAWRRAWAPSAAVLGDGRILVVGLDLIAGDQGADRFVNRAIRVDPATGVVERRAVPETSATSGSLVRLIDGRVALLGRSFIVYGSGGGVPVRRVDAYDPARDEWSYLTSLPMPRVGAGIAVDGLGRIYVAGGQPFIEDIGLPQPTDTLLVWTP